MEKRTKKKRPMGRPKSDNPRSTQLPVVRVTPDELLAYKRAAIANGISFSELARQSLDRFVKFSERRRKTRISNIQENEHYRFILVDGKEITRIVKKIRPDRIDVRELLSVGVGPTIHRANNPKNFSIKFTDIFDVRGRGLDELI